MAMRAERVRSLHSRSLSLTGSALLRRGNRGPGTGVKSSGAHCEVRGVTRSSPASLPGGRLDRFWQGVFDTVKTNHLSYCYVSCRCVLTPDHWMPDTEVKHG